MTNTSKKSGFTLVELAIVLVIIGLIIGGVLVGQDLIKAATIRSAITDVEKFNAAATTFRGKYNGLPGDLAAAKAVEFNFSLVGDLNAAGTIGLRDGNGSITDGAGNAGAGIDFSGESALFWKDLGNASLVGGSYTAIGAVETAPLLDAANRSTYMPVSKLRDSANYHAYSNGGRNYFYIGTFTQVAGAAGTVALPAASALTAAEAKSIDEKVDDGLPTSGVVVSMTDLVTPYAGAAVGAGICVNQGAGAPIIGDETYNVSSAATGAASNIVCELQLRASF